MKKNYKLDTKYIHILVEPEFKSVLIKKAQEKGLPLNTYIRMILLDSVKKDEK